LKPQQLPEVINHTLLWLSFFPPTHPGFSARRKNILGQINFIPHPLCRSFAFQMIMFDRLSLRVSLGLLLKHKNPVVVAANEQSF
jgi:hypothetical protein